jgi:hypothetical protein
VAPAEVYQLIRIQSLTFACASLESSNHTSDDAMTTAARDKAIRAARQAAKDKTMHAMQLQRQLQWEQEQVAKKLDPALAIFVSNEEVAKLTLIVECQKQHQAKKGETSEACRSVQYGNC